MYSTKCREKATKLATLNNLNIELKYHAIINDNEFTFQIRNYKISLLKNDFRQILS